MKGDSLARIRSRNSWVSIREIPSVHATSSAESTMVECGVAENNLEQSSPDAHQDGNSKKIHRRPTPRYQSTGDRRQDDFDDTSVPLRDRLDRVQAPDEGMGFEVAMSLGESGSTRDESDTTGNRTYSSTEGSGLDFPLDELPGSASTSVYDASKSGIHNGRNHSSTTRSPTDANGESTNFFGGSQATRGRKSLFVDVKAEQTSSGNGPSSDRKDATPRTTNRSDCTKTSKFTHSPAYKMSLKSKKKEGVAETLATVIMEVNNPMKRRDSESQMDQLLNYTETDDSSAEVDARWETFHAKYAGVEDRRKVARSGSSSIDDSGEQQQWRDRLLDVNSYTSPKSVESGGSETFEDFLIQDCVDTGLPSPGKRRSTRGTRTRDNHQTFNDSSHNSSNDPSSKTPTRDNVSPKRIMSQLRETNQEGEFDKGTVKDDVLKRAEAQSVSSNLTGDDDDNSRDDTCSQIQTTLSSFSDMDDMNGNKIVPRLSDAISSPSEDLTIESQLNPSRDYADEKKDQSTILHEKKQLVLPKRSLMEEYEANIQTPKIEISLVPSTSGSEDSLSDVSDSSCAFQRQYPESQLGERCSPLSPERGAQRPQHESEEISTESQGRLHWWAKNGKRLVNQKLGNPPNPTTRCDSSNTQTITRMGSEVGFTEPRLHQNQSLFDDNSSTGKDNPPTTEKYASAFKRGISMFEKGNAKATKSTLLRRERIQFRGSTKPLSTMRLSREERETSIHAPQPKPDADGSNSIGHERRNKVLTDDKKPNSFEEIIVSKPTVDYTATNRGRFSRPGHEDRSVNGAIGLGPSPKVRSDIDCKPTPTSEARSHKNNFDMHRSQYCRSDEKKKMIITAQNHFFGRRRIASSDRSESDYSADILDVASTLTGETSLHQQPDTCSTAISPSTLPSEQKNEEQNNKSVTVNHNNEPTFDAKGPSPAIPSWRMESTESLSDFTIQVFCTRSGRAAWYHVHKHILGVGPRRSEFLLGVFRSNTVSTAKIALEDEASAYVSKILDYAYCHDLKLDLTTENVMAYRYLARVFKIFPVLEETAKFMLPDMTIENMSTYISNSSRFDDEIVTHFIATKCGEHIESIKITDVLWTVMDPLLFLRVISCPKIDRRKVSTQLSLLLVDYHSLHKYEMSVKIFEDVSALSILPLIHHEAAIPLLEICEGYGAPISLQPLQKRCAQVMACYWKTTSDADRKRLFSLLRSLPSHFTVDFLELVESGNTMAWLDDSTLTKVLRDSKRIAQNSDEYKGADSFTFETLCGHFARKADHDLSLSWRMDPVFSFSDWTVKVKYRNEDKIDVYHVHKHILSIGQYKCTFFAETFLSENHTNSTAGSTTMELAQGPAEMIPVVLDFLYSPGHELIITTRTACVLRFLSRVFGIWMLNREVVEYVQRDMDLTNMLFYLGNAELYDDDRIMNIAIRKCAIGIKGIDPESDLLPYIKPDIFGRIIASSEIDKSASCHVNILIAKYFTLHDLDESLLAELMKQVPMRECDQDSALKLLDVMSSVKAQGITIFADVRKRCADILVENWKDICETNREATFAILRTLDSSLVTAIFDAVDNDYMKDNYEAMSIQSKLVKRYRAQLADAKTQRDEELAKLRQQNDLVVSELLKKNEELEVELAVYRDATSRRALRSCGGFPQTRLHSPRRNIIESSRPSLIPRPTSRSVGPPSPISIPEGQNQQGKQSQEMTCEQHASLFGRVFGCTPDTTEHGSTRKGMPSALDVAQYHQQHIAGHRS